jgi:hypothetical protein
MPFLSVALVPRVCPNRLSFAAYPITRGKDMRDLLWEGKIGLNHKLLRKY